MGWTDGGWIGASIGSELSLLMLIKDDKTMIDLTYYSHTNTTNGFPTSHKPASSDPRDCIGLAASKGKGLETDPRRFDGKQSRKKTGLGPGSIGWSRPICPPSSMLVRAPFDLLAMAL